jgi:hypothetical protein
MNSKIDPLYETRYTRGCTSIYIWIYFKRIDRQARTTKDNGLFRTNCSMDGEQTDRHNIYINVLLLYSIKDIYKIVAYLKCKNVNPLSMVQINNHLKTVKKKGNNKPLHLVNSHCTHICSLRIHFLFFSTTYKRMRTSSCFQVSRTSFSAVKCKNKGDFIYQVK